MSEEEAEELISKIVLYPYGYAYEYGKIVAVEGKDVFVKGNQGIKRCGYENVHVLSLDEMKEYALSRRSR